MWAYHTLDTLIIKVFFGSAYRACRQNSMHSIAFLLPLQLIKGNCQQTNQAS